MSKFEVQTFTVCDGWINTWMVDGHPQTFAARSEAEQAITEHLTDVAQAVKAGDMSSGYSRDEFRVVELDA